jgi:hypothetical protein
MKLHHNSGNLFLQLRKGRPVQMHLECGGVSVHFVRENFRIVVFSAAGLRIAGCPVHLSGAPCVPVAKLRFYLAAQRNLDCDDVRKF